MQHLLSFFLVKFHVLNHCPAVDLSSPSKKKNITEATSISPFSVSCFLRSADQWKSVPSWESKGNATTPTRTKALLRDFQGIMVVKNKLYSPWFWWCVEDVDSSEGNFRLGCQADRLQLSFQGKEARTVLWKQQKWEGNMLEMMGDVRWNLDEFGSFM